MITPRLHRSAPPLPSGPDQASRSRKIAALLIRSSGFLLGATFASIYLFLAWESPPDMSHAPLRTPLNFYLTGPILLFGGPVLLADWIAGRIDHRRLTD
jgi:hypothetical protein